MTEPLTPTGQILEAESPSSQDLDPRRWLALGVIAVAQLMIILDASIVNIALPSAQRDLGISDADRQWVVTAYLAGVSPGRPPSATSAARSQFRAR